MPSFLAYRHGLMSHLGSTFPKNDGPGPCPGADFFTFLVFFQNVLKRALEALGGPGGPISLDFSPFSPFPPLWGLHILPSITAVLCLLLAL